MKIASLSLFLLVTRVTNDSLNILEITNDHICELTGVSRKLSKIFELIESNPFLASYSSLEFAKKVRDKFQKSYDKEIMIFRILITTEAEVIY
jgi:hypothetical protein